MEEAQTKLLAKVAEGERKEKAQDAARCSAEAELLRTEVRFLMRHIRNSPPPPRTNI